MKSSFESLQVVSSGNNSHLISLKWYWGWKYFLCTCKSYPMPSRRQRN